MNLGERLRFSGKKLTRQRESVFEVLLEGEGRPMSPDEVFRACEARRAGAGLTTVYRTLELFCEIGVALPVHLHSGARYYELDTGAHHHHLVCVGCGSVEPVADCIVHDMEARVRQKRNFMVTSHCLSLFGLCTDCNQETG